MVAQLIDGELTLSGEGIRLTPREIEILSFIAQGFRSQEVADLLFVSKRTIDFHLANAFSKLQVGNRVQAILAASRMGFLPVEHAFGFDAGLRDQIELELVSNCPEQYANFEERAGFYAMQKATRENS